MIRRLVLLNAFLASAAGGCDGWHKLDNPSKNCTWVSKNPASRCYDTYGGDIPARTACAGACGTVDAVKADSTTWFHTKDNGKEKGCDWVRDDAMTMEGPGVGEIPARCIEARGQENAAACCEVCAAPTGIGENEAEDDCASNAKRGRCQREFACGWSKKTGCSSQTSDDCYSGKARKKAKHCKKIDCCEWDGGECGANGACDSLGNDDEGHCEDDTSWRNEDGKGCSWVAKDSEDRCDNDEVRDACEETCDEC